MVVRARGYDGPVSPIGYGVDLTTFSSASSIRRRCDVDRPFAIGYVGRLVEEKGLDDALDAMAMSGDAGHSAHHGRGAPRSEASRADRRARALIERVSFRGWGSPSDVADFLRSLDALVLLTRTTSAVKEQFGRVIIEAQACGVPVIGSTCGAIPDVVGDGGWIVPERDPHALRTLLNQIAIDPALVRAKGLAARSNVQARFTYEAVATAIETACRAAADATGAIR